MRFRLLSLMIALTVFPTLGSAQVDAEHQRQWDNSLAQRRQQIEDSRAMLRQSWENYRESMVVIEMGFKCGLYDGYQAKAAMTKFEMQMVQEAAQVGLQPLQVMDMRTFMRDVIRRGDVAAETGACGRLSAADRGRMRQMVANLSQF